MTGHPLAPMVPEMIAKVGWDPALRWWMLHAMECPNAIPDCLDVIDAMLKGDEDRMILDEHGEEVCHAFQMVRVFDLAPFVEAARVS